MTYKWLSIWILLLFFSALTIKNPVFQVLDFALLQEMVMHRNTLVNTITIALSVIGGLPIVLFLTTICCLYFVWSQKYALVIFISVGLIGSIVFTWLLKYIIARPRPPEMYHLVHSYGASFPSAHSCYAAAFGAIVCYISLNHPKHRWICCCMGMWVVVMGMSRVYLGVHFLSDVVSGWSISFIWVSVLFLCFNKTGISITKF